MSSITRFIIDSKQRILTVELSEKSTWEFPMEYLRVIDLNGITANAKQTLVTNKKEVQLNNIESVGKHGYRLCFDDSYQVVLTQQQLGQLNLQYESLWRAYLDAIKNSGLTRETAIDFKAL